MVCLCSVGGRLNLDIQARLDEAARVHAQNKLDVAAALYREILASRPHEPGALHMLGVIAQQEGNAALALNWIDAALTVEPNFLKARYNRSIVLRTLGRNDEAMQSVRKILDAAPQFAAAWDMAGQILKDEGLYDDAAKCFRLAIELQPDKATFHGNYALLLYASGDWQGAYKEARAAESLDPSFPPMLLGNILWAWGHPEQAVECFKKARTLLPSAADACASEAMARLQMGNMEDGFALWEHRPDLSPDLHALPFWQGQKVHSLLLYEDQGLGDAVQFMRYVPLVKERADHVTLRLRSPLADLGAKNFTDVPVIAETDPVPSAEARCRLSSLPYLFATRLSNIPAAPYLKAEESFAKGCEIEHLASPRIGLVWAGNAKFHNDSERSIDFHTLHPLVSACAPHLVSIQKDHKEDLAAAGIFDASPLLHTFADTAALLSELDLIISVDTATAHLAGALGKPVFVLLPFNSDWRWLMGRDDSPWYGSARLFRQERPGDWDTVIADVTAEVQKLIAGDKGVLQPRPWHGAPLRENPYAIQL